MKFSVITVCYNSEKTIRDNVESVGCQNQCSYEHIIIDGGSVDNTLKIINKFSNPNIIIKSERDNGIYDAMNKGVKLADGDVVCFLNSDDIYPTTNVLSQVQAAFEKFDGEFAWGNISLCDDLWVENRYWRTTSISYKQPKHFRQLPHPGVFVRREKLLKLGIPFDCRYRLAADLDQQLRMIYLHSFRGIHIDSCLVKMRLGGASTRNITSHFDGFKESTLIYNNHFTSGGSIFSIRKILQKLKQK
jgi:glycosyltransferase